MISTGLHSLKFTGAIALEYLDAVILSISNIHLTIIIHRYSSGFIELSRVVTGSAPNCYRYLPKDG